MKKLVIIPAYNEEGNILGTVKAIRENAPDFDYIVINDCSTDRTKNLLAGNGINHINLPLNLGIGGAVQTGYQYAYRYGYDVAVQMDGDGQHVPSFLDEMAEVISREQVDMVIGSRFIHKDGFQSSLSRRIGIRFFSALLRLCTGQRITDPTSGMRMVGKRTIALFADHYPKDYPEPETIATLLRRGYRIKEIPVEMKSRESGKSSIGGFDSIYYMIKVSIAVLIESSRGKKNDQ